jgi:hypothetical protein
VYKADAMFAYRLTAEELDDVQKTPLYTREDVRQRAWRRWGSSAALEQAKAASTASNKALQRAKKRASEAKRRAKAAARAAKAAAVAKNALAPAHAAAPPRGTSQ